MWIWGSPVRAGAAVPFKSSTSSKLIAGCFQYGLAGSMLSFLPALQSPAAIPCEDPQEWQVRPCLDALSTSGRPKQRARRRFCSRTVHGPACGSFPHSKAPDRSIGTGTAGARNVPQGAGFLGTAGSGCDIGTPCMCEWSRFLRAANRQFCPPYGFLVGINPPPGS